jgi:hypothetical protein
MCDYSLHAVDTRPAQVGDVLVSTRFIGSLTRGFCAAGEPQVAVCLRPGTELAFEREVEIDHALRRLLPSFGFGRLTGKLARFRQFDMHRPDVHHDALEFADGRVVLVTQLCEGQRASVLQLPPAAAAPEPHADEAASRRRHEALLE